MRLATLCLLLAGAPATAYAYAPSVRQPHRTSMPRVTSWPRASLADAGQPQQLPFGDPLLLRTAPAGSRTAELEEVDDLRQELDAILFVKEDTEEFMNAKVSLLQDKALLLLGACKSHSKSSN